MFLAIVLSIWALMHLYVFWRLSTIPFISAYLPQYWLVLVALVLWCSFPLARMLESTRLAPFAVPLEIGAAMWIGVLFLLLVSFLAADVVTAGGWLWPAKRQMVRTGAALVGVALSLVAMVQGLRPPALSDYEVVIPGLPADRDGLVLVHASDLHLGTIIGKRWLNSLIERIHPLRPDLVVLVGDVVDGNVRKVQPLVDSLKKLRAPLGVFGVTGNHEYYAGVDGCVDFMEAAGVQVLRDRAVQIVPGLVLAGVDDLTVRQQSGQGVGAVERVLSSRPPGGVILLSHSPLQVEQAASAGAALMLSGHTHAGQIWPFRYLVKSRYPRVSGRYHINGMDLIVCRGTGTWGPRMRLWKRAELVRITLRSLERGGTSLDSAVAGRNPA